MNSYLVYRASFYLMLVVATMASSGDGQEGPFGRLYTLAVVVAGIVAFFTVDRQRQWALPRPSPTPWRSGPWSSCTSNTRSTTPR